MPQAAVTTPIQAANLILDFLAGFSAGRDPGHVQFAHEGTVILRAVVEGTEFEIRLIRKTPRKRQSRPQRTVHYPVTLKLYTEEEESHATTPEDHRHH
jgi:hypothetical protein